MGGGVREKNDESISFREMPSRAVLKVDNRKRAIKKRMEDAKDGRDHDKSKITGSPKFVKFTVSPPNKPGETNVENKIKKQRRVKPAGTKTESNHIKLTFARKNWEEAMNPAAALARTKKAKGGAYDVSARAQLPQGERKAFAEDASNTLFECRDDDNVVESIGETAVALPNRESTSKASKVLFSDTGSCYYGETNDEKVIAEDRTIYTAVTATGLCEVTSAGPPPTKYFERKDWTEATRAWMVTACCWTAGAFDHSGGAGDDNRFLSASAPVIITNRIRLIDGDAGEWAEADSFREKNGSYSAGSIRLGVEKPNEAPHPFPFDPCCGAHVLLSACARKSDNSVHPCDNSKSGSSRQTRGTRLSADAIEWTATDIVKVDNDCDDLAGETELGGHRQLSIWMRRLKNRAVRKSQPAKEHPQSQYLPGEKNDDNTRTCNTCLPVRYITKDNSLIDSDAVGLTGADFFRETNDDDSPGIIAIGDKKPAEGPHPSAFGQSCGAHYLIDPGANKLSDAPHPFPFDPCCGAHVLLSACARKSDNSVHPCDNSKSGSSRQTRGTRLSADAIEWTATDIVKVDNDCDDPAGQTALGGHRRLSIWMRRLKNRAATASKPAMQHPQSQYLPGEKDDDNTRSCNTFLPVRYITNGKRLIDSDAVGLTGADLVTSKINGDGTVYCAVPSEALGESHGHDASSARNKHQLHDASQLADASQLTDASQLVGVGDYDEGSLANLSSDDTTELMIRVQSALEITQASDQIPSRKLSRKSTMTPPTQLP